MNTRVRAVSFISLKHLELQSSNREPPLPLIMRAKDLRGTTGDTCSARGFRPVMPFDIAGRVCFYFLSLPLPSR